MAYNGFGLGEVAKKHAKTFDVAKTQKYKQIIELNPITAIE